MLDAKQKNKTKIINSKKQLQLYTSTQETDKAIQTINTAGCLPDQKFGMERNTIFRDSLVDM